MEDIDIRESRPEEFAAIESLYLDAFPEEDLLPLVEALLAGKADVISLVGYQNSSLAGHVIFTICGTTESEEVKVGLLGPLAVASDRQRQGIGSALVRAGLKRLEQAGVRHVCVLGDPKYYGRFQFIPGAPIAPPYPLPAEWRGAWQSMSLGSDSSLPSGVLAVPEPWQRPALWAP